MAAFQRAGIARVYCTTAGQVRPAQMETSEATQARLQQVRVALRIVYTDSILWQPCNLGLAKSDNISLLSLYSQLFRAELLLVD